MVSIECYQLKMKMHLNAKFNLLISVPIFIFSRHEYENQELHSIIGAQNGG
jgi:hypothetical protein